jgi:heme exporter protein D
MSDYLAMGGYAAFVWPAYGLSVLVMLALVIAVWRSLRANERDLARLQAQRPTGDSAP